MQVLPLLGKTAGFIVLLAVIVNSIIMCEVLGRKGASERLRLLHRLIGRVTMIGFVLFFIGMVPRLALAPQLPVIYALHAVVGLALIPLVAAKFLVAGRYRHYWNGLPALGFAITAATVIVIMFSSGVELMQALAK
ncbi:MAG: hypothetical protein V2B18_20950 [Pseudomonadota bacterium]